MLPDLTRPCTAFSDTKKIAAGDILEVALKVQRYLKEHKKSQVHVFDDSTSAPIELDLRGTPDDLRERLRKIEESTEKKSGPGRPKLGVVSKEVTLLPQHWEWLSIQPGGASVTLRKLIEEAKKKNVTQDQIRLSQEATYKFMNVMAGNLENFEEALRTLYAKDAKGFELLIAGWPKDIREHARGLSRRAFQKSSK